MRRGKGVNGTEREIFMRGFCETMETVWQALRRGNDVEIQNTKNGVRIVEKKCRVVTRIEQDTTH